MKAARAGVAIVTGASRGIGEEIARRLAREGNAVVVNCAATQMDGEKVVADIRSAGGHALCVRADVSSAQEAKDLYDMTEREFGPVTILVNNAGVNQAQPTMLTDVNDDTFDHIFDVNTRGPFLMMREAGRRMPKGGRIVNISSTVNLHKVLGMAVYGGSKAAVEAMSGIFARELGGREITVNCVSPGPTATELFFQGKSQEMIETFALMPPANRLGTPAEIAGVVAFLVGPDAGWINGQVIPVNGGIV